VCGCVLGENGCGSETESLAAQQLDETDSAVAAAQQLEEIDSAAAAAAVAANAEEDDSVDVNDDDGSSTEIEVVKLVDGLPADRCDSRQQFDIAERQSASLFVSRLSEFVATFVNKAASPLDADRLLQEFSSNFCTGLCTLLFIGIFRHLKRGAIHLLPLSLHFTSLHLPYLLTFFPLAPLPFRPSEVERIGVFTIRPLGPWPPPLN